MLSAVDGPLSRPRELGNHNAKGEWGEASGGGEDPPRRKRTLEGPSTTNLRRAKRGELKQTQYGKETTGPTPDNGNPQTNLGDNLRGGSNGLRGGKTLGQGNRNLIVPGEKGQIPEEKSRIARPTYTPHVVNENSNG